MSNEYIIHYSDDAIKAPLQINPRTIDRKSSSVVLFGKGAQAYGDEAQESLLHLLENFCSDISPLSPTEGQLWYDTTIKALHVCTGFTTNPLVPPINLANPNDPHYMRDVNGARIPIWSEITGVAASRGPAGATGSQGVPGARGPIGIPGLPGPIGPQGIMGPQGIQGVTGPTGPKGDLGLTGAVGARGPTGAAGPTGANGANGANGIIPPQPYEVGTFISLCQESTIYCLHIFNRVVVFPINFTGSHGATINTIVADADFDVQKNGVSIGTIHFAAGHTTATFTLSTETTFNIGDLLTIISPSIILDSLVNITFLLAGERQ